MSAAEALSVSEERAEVSSEEYRRIAVWIAREAHTLDRGQLREWLAFLSHEIEYRMPVREAILPKEGDGFSDSVALFSETYSSLKTRVERLYTDFAWAEQPLSRVRHLVTNIMAERCEDGFQVTSAFMVARIRSDTPYDLFTGERRDTLREEAGGLKLVRRIILMDQTIIKSNNLSMFF